MNKRKPVFTANKLNKKNKNKNLNKQHTFFKRIKQNETTLMIKY